MTIVFPNISAYPLWNLANTLKLSILYAPADLKKSSLQDVRLNVHSGLHT